MLEKVLARAGGFLLEPAETRPPARAPAAPRASSPAPASLAVVGLSPGSGARTTAAGLVLALRSHGQAPHLVCIGASRATVALDRACEVPAALIAADEVASYGGTLLRLAAAGSSVWSVPAREAPRAATVMGEADAVLAVAGRTAEPALSGMVCSLLAERCGRVLLVGNRPPDPAEWSAWAAACLPDARFGAAAVTRGRLPGGRYGTALLELAALAVGVAADELAPHHGLFTRSRSA
jgi:hypothetical protein